jgi:hypothetical protein
MKTPENAAVLLRSVSRTAGPKSTPSHRPPPLVIAGLDPAIHPLKKLMNARVKPAHDDGTKRPSFAGPVF